MSAIDQTIFDAATSAFDVLAAPPSAARTEARFGPISRERDRARRA